MNKPLLKVILIYTATVLILLTAGLVSGEDAVTNQFIISLLLLGLLTVYLTRLRHIPELGSRAGAVSNVLLLFFLAMAARSIFIGLFRFPAEKVPVIFLVALTSLLVDRRPLSAIGLSGVSLSRSATLGVLVGLAFYYLSWLTAVPIGYLTGRPADLAWQLPDAYGFVWSVVNAFLFAALSEELLFRGYIQGRLEGVVGPNNALVYSALLFGFWHIARGIPYVSDPGFAVAFASSYMLFAGLAGVLFGELYRSTKSIVPPMIAHGLWNTLTGISPAYRLLPISVWQSLLEPLSFGLIILALVLFIPRLVRYLKIERL